VTKNAGVGSDDQHLSDAREARRSEQGHVRPLRLPRVGVGSRQEVPGTLLGVRDGGAGGVRGTSSRPPGSAKHKGPHKLETGSFYLLGCLEVWSSRKLPFARSHSYVLAAGLRELCLKLCSVSAYNLRA
jgi:hypothetical protein